MREGSALHWNQVEFTASYGLFSQIPPCDSMEIAFAGRSNVGKSSLINKLFARKAIARVSSMPGKTTTINFFSLDGIRFADLPGYGYAKVSKTEKTRWAGLIEGYLNSDRDIALLFQLIDMRHPPSQDDIHMVNFLIDSGMPFVVALTKADKLRPKEREARLAALRTELPCAEQIIVVPCSAETGEGIPELRAIIEELAAERAAEQTEEE